MLESCISTDNDTNFDSVEVIPNSHSISESVRANKSD